MRPGARVRVRVAALASLVVLLSACSPEPPGPARTSSDAAPARPTASAAVITATPADGTQGVAADAPVRVAVARGTLTSVRLVDDKGAQVPGHLAADGSSWTPDARLAPATPYTLDAVARDPAGLTAVQHSGFATLAREHTFTASLTPEDGSAVGTGMPVSLRFSRPITDRAAVERAVTVSADPPVPVVGHWFGSQRLDLRPERYWAPGTRVTLAVALNGVQGAPGDYGIQNKQIAFDIGRSQVSTADLDTHLLTVRQGARLVRTLPISAGNPEHGTYQGVMVISEKSEVTRMNSQTVGMGDEYDIKDVPHAMRLTASGTFVHGNYWAGRSVFGTANTTHGCIGLADEKGGSPDSPAGWLFTHSLLGDVIEVRSRDAGDQVQPENGLNGWNLTWAQWVKGSALGVH